MPRLSLVLLVASSLLACAPQRTTAAVDERLDPPRATAPLPADAERILVEARANAGVPSYEGVAIDAKEGANKARDLEQRASLAQREGRYADADAPLLEAIAIWKRIGGPEHVDVLNDEMNLAVAWRRRGDFARSVPVLERVVVRLAASADPDARGLVLQAKNNLATAYRSAGRRDRAREMWEECLRAHDASLGARPDAERARVLDNLSQVVAELGDAPAAERLARRGLAEWTALRGDDDVDTAKSKGSVAAALLMQHRLDEAEPLLMAALRTMEAKSHGLDVASLLTLVGKLRFERGDRTAARAAFARALEITKGFYSDDHVQVRELRRSLAVIDGP